MLVDFYHLAATPIERVLPRICERLLREGQRLLVVAEEAVLGQLDDQLWTYAPESFLPHGRGGKPLADKQPILLSTDVEPLNGAENVALADGVWREEALSFARTFYLFDNSHLDTAQTDCNPWREISGSPSAHSVYERRY